ncbi:pyridoxal phosphate-dependent aminotransferase [Cryptosporangium arvum]|uniref:PLP-dependent enzyme, histidinol-phosphate/aromatic aminotransferase or cobyric acid decarboxylase n=1 Tax=Cryptosporangium arvum DSM 44712 TaxID=927661 RepID=A0A010Z0N8_9ACTN|nr:histidinol-phosphate transaminase [Cryptosporangium arvum]EXG81023.1 PLP-dependent enzyme, histidinol-phosphate/aromatic aminotransferase or cobyric acid decarboxylase [Cryptosporangium arvum DSM 44712]
MKHSMDLGMFRQGNHSPSYATLSRSMGAGAEDLSDFCIPCNPYFPTPEMFAELASKLETMLKYYPTDAGAITGQLASLLQMPPQTIAMGNGSTELITWIDHLLITESMATPVPTFGRWTDQSLETGKRVDMFQLPEAGGFALDIDAYIEFIRERGSRVAVVCNPNNPDGNYIPKWEVLRFVDSLADRDLVVVDESFIDFVDAEHRPSIAQEAMLRNNVVVLKSLGKNFGLHGIRFGYVVGNPALVKKIGSRLPKWNLNSLAESVVFMLRDHLGEYRESLRLLARDRYEMINELRRIPGMQVFPSQGNFVLVKLPAEVEGPRLRDYLLQRHGVLIRECGNKLGITSQFVRLVVRPRADTERLLTGIRSYLTSSFSESLDGATPMDLAGRFAQPSGVQTGTHQLIDDDPLGDRVVPLMGSDPLGGPRMARAR